MFRVLLIEFKLMQEIVVWQQQSLNTYTGDSNKIQATPLSAGVAKRKTSPVEDAGPGVSKQEREHLNSNANFRTSITYEETYTSSVGR
jgi:hypothetical protein